MYLQRLYISLSYEIFASPRPRSFITFVGRLPLNSRHVCISLTLMVHSESRKLGHCRSNMPHPSCICLGSPVAGEVRWREAAKTDHKRPTCLCLLHAFRSYSGCSLPTSIMLVYQKHDQEFEDGCYSATSVIYQSFVKVKKRKRSWMWRFSRLRLFGFDRALYFEWVGREISRACYYSSQLQGRFGHAERNIGRSSMPSTSKHNLWSRFASTKLLEI